MAKKVKYNKEIIIEHLQKHNDKNGKITVCSFNADKSVCSVTTVSIKFGSWLKGLEAAGLRKKISKEQLKKREQVHSRGELIGKYRRLKRREKYKSKDIKLEDFYMETKIDVSLIIRYFRDWKNFCKISKKG